MLVGDLSKVPIEDGQVSCQLIDALICSFRVVEDLLTLVQRQKEIFVHLGHLEPLPEISDRFLVISHILKSEEWIVTLCFDCDVAFLDNLFTIIVCLDNRGLGLLVHSLASDAYQVDVKIKSQLWFEHNIDDFL